MQLVVVVLDGNFVEKPCPNFFNFRTFVVFLK